MRVAVDFTGAANPRGGTWRYGVELARGLAESLPKGAVRVPVFEPLAEELLDEVRATGARVRTGPLTSRVDVLDGMSRRRGRYVPWDKLVPLVYRPWVRRGLMSRAVAGCDVYHAVTVSRSRPRCRATVGSIIDMIPALYPGSCLMSTETHAALVEGHRKYADLIAVPCRAVRDDILRLTNVPAEKLRVTYYGIDHAMFHPDVPLPQELLATHGLTAGRYFLFVGSLERRKNVDRMVKAYLAAVPPDADCPLVLAGAKGHDHPALKDVLAAGDGRVRPIGYVPDGALPGLYAAARGLVHVALTEGFGFTPLESMACGTPAVVANVGASGELVGDAGLAVDPFSEDEIARAVHTLRTDDAARAKLADAGRQRAAAFTWAATAKATLAVYREALDVAKARGEPVVVA
jgi:alpha-1,3-rhamnosyl/mannosyltransferase